MYWEDESKKEPVLTSDKVTDVCYKVNCKQLPAMHAVELAAALTPLLPWLDNEPGVAIHQIHGATSGNGWERPADNEIIHLSRRTRLQLRIPKTRIEDAAQLSGKVIEVAGNSLTIGDMSEKPINPLATLFSRYVAGPSGLDEEAFLQWAAEQLGDMGIQVKKMLCGKSHEMDIATETLHTRSLMIADLDTHASVLLQEQGLGSDRLHGCGIFLPHKGIKAVGDTEDKSHFTGA